MRFIGPLLLALPFTIAPSSFAAAAGVTTQCADLGQFGADCSVAELADPDGTAGFSIVIDGIRFSRISPADPPGAAISSRLRVVPQGAGSVSPGLRFEADGDALAAPASYALSFLIDSALGNRAITVGQVSLDAEFDPAAGPGDVSGSFATLDRGQIDQLVQFADPSRSGVATLPVSLVPGRAAAPGVQTSFAVEAGMLRAFECSITLGAVLEIAKVAVGPVVNVGYDLEYLVTASNGSLHDLSTLTLVDPLPGGVLFQSATPSQGICSWDGMAVLCDLGDLAGGTSAQIAIDGQAPLVAGTIDNAATADSAETGAATAVETVLVREAIADLGVSIVDDPDPVAPGGETVYRIEVENAGPGNATQTTLSVVLPPDAIPFAFTTDPQGTCNRFANLVTCHLGTIGPSDVGNSLVVVEIFVILPVEGLFTTTATAIAAEPDPGGDPHQSSEETLVIVPRLAVDKIDDIDPVNAGRPFSYTLTTTNYRGGIVTGVALSDTLPAGLTLLAATPTRGACGLSGGTVSCDLGSLLPGEAAQVRIEVVAPATPGDIHNSAGAISDSDPVPIVATEDTTVLPAVAELSLTTVSSPGPVTAGDEVTWTHQVSNAGPGNANSATLVDDLPADAVFTGVNAGNGVTCSHLAGRVTCSLGGLRPGALRPGEGASVGISARLISPGDAVNLTTVSADEPDPGVLPNTTSSTVSVLLPPELGITDSINHPDDRLLDFGPVDARDVVTGSITLANLGGQGLAVAGIAAAPQPPFALEDPGACIGSILPAGGSCVLIISYAPAGPGLYDDRLDLDFGAFIAPIVLTGESPIGLADVSLTKQSDRGEILVPGGADRFTFTLSVSNAGPDPAEVEVRDKLPRGLQIPAGVAPITSRGDYDPQSGLWRVGALARGEIETLLLVAEREKNFLGCVSNEAEARIAAPGPSDPNPADNSARVDVGVGGCTDLAILDIAGQFVPSVPRRARWDLTFGMLGPGSAVQPPFSIALRLPSGATFESLTLSGEQVAPLNCQARGRQVECAIQSGAPLICGPLQGFTLCRAEITARAPLRLSGPLAIVLEAATSDPVPGNNRGQFDGP